MPEGRPTRLTPAVEERILHAIKLGSSRADAAQFARVGERTLREWLRLGAEEVEGPHATLRARVLEAEANVRVALTGSIVKAGVRDWRAALAFLQCRHPSEYAEKSILFLVKHALQEMEKAAEANGVAIPPDTWSRAWANAARQIARGIPETTIGVRLAPGSPSEESALAGAVGRLAAKLKDEKVRAIVVGALLDELRQGAGAAQAS
ncbi:MAG TPA: hypothetical protein VFX78_10925 [Candidatus Eisenbacteria bacterium]|nr:hypothetical protein [Candidatus Eisenbacteria bacterium]